MGNDIKVSLFASAVRPKLWSDLFNSLKNTSVEYEVVFAGNITPDILSINSKLTWIKTNNIKPAQCYEIARINCNGEVVIWIADDCEFPNNVIGKAYDYWKSKNNEKLILSLQTKESGYGTPEGKLFDMNMHRFYGNDINTPLMAPIGMMSREYLNELGGFDKRFICGQYENFAVQLAYMNGATVEIFGNENCYVDIDHLRKSIAIGESTDEESFQERPFAKGYQLDRQVLENSWTTFDESDVWKRLEAGERPTTLRKMSHVMIGKFEPYTDEELLTKSQGNNLTDRWV